ncbi:MAG: hypothetical protein U0103_26880 [Candidatus Obscuribacterales bacterium]
MSSFAPNADLLRLTLDLWNEAEVEHVDVKHADCPACWKAYMANLLWKKVTGLLAPTSYYEEHRRAARHLQNVRVLRTATAKAA